MRFLPTFFALRNGGSRHASNWAFVGAAIRASVFFFDTSREILTSQNRKGNSQCVCYAFFDWRHPKREELNSPTLFHDRHAKKLLPCRNLLSTTFVNRSQNEKWLNNDRNFHFKIEPKIGREKPIDFLLFFGFVERPLRELKFTPLFFNFFKVTMSNSLVL